MQLKILGRAPRHGGLTDKLHCHRYKTHSKEKDQGLLTATLPRRDSPVPVAYIFPRRCSRPSEGETNVRKSPDSGRFSVVFPFMVIKR